MLKIKLAYALLFLYSVSVGAEVTDSDFERCTFFLDKIVSTSNAKLISDLKVDRRLINVNIDNVSDDEIFAKVQFNNKQSVDTPGNGFLLWMKYNYVNFKLEDITIDPDNPQKLKFDERYSIIYSDCLAQKSIYEVSGNSRLQFYKDEQLSIASPGLFILPGEYLEVVTYKEKSSFVKYHSRSGAEISAWMDSKRVQKVNYN